MARSTAAFERVIELAIKNAQPPEIQKRHAEIARKGLADHLRTIKGGKPTVTTFVDGRKDASEDSVKAYGVIRYEFTRLAEIAAFALKRAQELSPVESGAYKAAWFVMAGGRAVDPGAIPNGVELVVTNDQPYHRKLELTVNADHWRSDGKARARLPAGIVERLRQEVYREFGKTVDASVSFITLQGGYVLKGRGKRRKDTAAGQQMTYPALILKPL